MRENNKQTKNLFNTFKNLKNYLKIFSIIIYLKNEIILIFCAHIKP